MVNLLRHFSKILIIFRRKFGYPCISPPHVKPWISWRSENVIIFELINSLQNILWLGNKMNQFWTQESLILVRLTAWMCSTLVIYYLDTFVVIFSKTFIKVPGNQKKQQTFLSIIWSSEIEKNLQRKLFKNYAKSMRLKGLN